MQSSFQSCETPYVLFYRRKLFADQVTTSSIHPLIADQVTATDAAAGKDAAEKDAAEKDQPATPVAGGGQQDVPPILLSFACCQLPPSDNRRADVLALITALVQASSVRDAAKLFGIRDHKRINLYMLNCVQQKRNRSCKLPPSDNRRKKPGKDSANVCSLKYAKSVEADVLSKAASWGPDSTLVQLLMFDFQGVVDETAALSMAQTNVVPILSVDLADCSDRRGIVVELLAQGDVLSVGVMPERSANRWHHQTFLDGTGSTSVYLRPNMQGRTTTRVGVFQWRIRMLHKPMSIKEHGMPLFDLFQVMPDAMGLLSRRCIVRGATSATAAWSNVPALKKLNCGPELFGLHHPKLVTLLQILNTQQHAQPTKAFKTMMKMDALSKKQHQQARSAVSSKIEGAIMETCPNDAIGCLHACLKDKKFRKEWHLDDGLSLDQIRKLPFVAASMHTFVNSRDPAVRIPILSQYAYDLDTFDYGTLQSMFECGRMTVYRARIHALMVGPGKPYERSKFEVFRFHPTQWCDLNIWALRDDVSQSSRNSSVDERHERELIETRKHSYLKYCHWCSRRVVIPYHPDHLGLAPVSESVYYEFFSSYAESTATTCEDTVEIAKDAALSEFEEEYIDVICGLANWPSQSKRLSKEMAWVRRFIRVDYPWRHCSSKSKCSMHGSIGALSCRDPEFDTSAACNEGWGTKNCSECDRIPQLFAELRWMLDAARSRWQELDADDQARVASLEVIVDRGEFSTVQYMGHMLRKRNSRVANLERKANSMVVGCAEHVFDHMNKLVDTWHAESQTDRFGKSGRTCFGHSFTTIAPPDFEGECNGTGSLLCVNVRLFCNDSKQDFEQSITLTHAAIALFKQVCPWVTKISGSKDGASCFLDAFQFAYPRVLEMHGLQAGTIDTPETSAGKDEQDQDFRGVQGSIRAATNSGFDCTSSVENCEAADKYQGPEKGKMNRVVTFQRGLGPQKLVKFTQGKMYRFQHEYDEIGEYSGTRVHRYAGVGTSGKLYTRSQIDLEWPSIHKLQDLSAALSTAGKKSHESFAFALKRTANERGSRDVVASGKRQIRADKKARVSAWAFEDESLARQEDGVFHCEVHGCDSAFLTETGLRRHRPNCHGKASKYDHQMASLADCTDKRLANLMSLDQRTIKTVEESWPERRRCHHCEQKFQAAEKEAEKECRAAEKATKEAAAAEDQRQAAKKAAEKAAEDQRKAVEEEAKAAEARQKRKRVTSTQPPIQHRSHVAKAPAHLKNPQWAECCNEWLEVEVYNTCTNKCHDFAIKGSACHVRRMQGGGSRCRQKNTRYSE